MTSATRLTPINPQTGQPGRPIPVEDPYNLYFTPDGHFAIVVAERLLRLDFRDPHTMKLVHSLSVPMCDGVDHADFSPGGRYMFASCEFNGRMIEVDLKTQRVLRTLTLNGGHASPQDVKISPDGKTLYTADQLAGGLWEINPSTFKVIGFLRTGAGAHGLYPSRLDHYMYVSNRAAGTISVVSFHTRRVIHTWTLPAAGQSGYGRRLGRRQHPVAERPLQRGRLRDQHRDRQAAGRRSRSAQGPTACACGPSPAATRWATPASCADATRCGPGPLRATRARAGGMRCQLGRLGLACGLARPRRRP